MKIRFLLAGALLVGTPVAVLLPGCGGGNSSPVSQTFSSNVPLSATQTGALTLAVRGSVATGTLVVSDTVANDARKTRAIDTIPSGTYTVSGTVSPPASFSVSGNLTGTGTFTIDGQLPTNGGNGAFTITVNGQTVSGTFGGATATPVGSATPGTTSTPVPSSTPSTTNSQAHLNVVSRDDAGFGPETFEVTNGPVASGTIPGFVAVPFVDAAGRRIAITVQLDSRPVVGNSYQLGTYETNISVTSGKQSWGLERFTTGQLLVTKVEGANGRNVTFQLQNAVVTPRPLGPNNSTGKGSLAITGTYTALLSS